MKNLKVLLALFIGSFIFSCSNVDPASENQTDTVLPKEQTDVVGKKAADQIAIQKLIKTTQEKITELESQSGLFFRKNLEVGEMIGNDFKIKEGIAYNILSFNYQLEALKTGYNIKFNSYEFVSDKDNNGYNFLILNGVDSSSKNTIAVGMVLIYNQDINTFKIDPKPHTVICTGCTEGCSPRINAQGDGSCTFCTGNCVKTESI